jgi:hypothetical protein
MRIRLGGSVTDAVRVGKRRGGPARPPPPTARATGMRAGTGIPPAHQQEVGVRQTLGQGGVVLAHSGPSIVNPHDAQERGAGGPSSAKRKSPVEARSIAWASGGSERRPAGLPRPGHGQPSLARQSVAPVREGGGEDLRRVSCGGARLRSEKRLALRAEPISLLLPGHGRGGSPAGLVASSPGEPETRWLECRFLKVTNSPSGCQRASVCWWAWRR